MPQRRTPEIGRDSSGAFDLLDVERVVREAFTQVLESRLQERDGRRAWKGILQHQVQRLAVVWALAQELRGRGFGPCLVVQAVTANPIAVKRILTNCNNPSSSSITRMCSCSMRVVILYAIMD